MIFLTGEYFSKEISSFSCLSLVTVVCATLLLEQTALDLEENTSKTLLNIFRGRHPYLHRDFRGLMVYVLDEKGKCLGHPKRGFTGQSMIAYIDADKKKYIEELVNTAQTAKDGTGSVTYTIRRPDKKMIDYKIFSK